MSLARFLCVQTFIWGLLKLKIVSINTNHWQSSRDKVYKFRQIFWWDLALTTFDWNVWSLLLMLTSKWNKIKIQPLNVSPILYLVFSLLSRQNLPQKVFPSFPIKYFPNPVQPARLRRKESVHPPNIFFNFLEAKKHFFPYSKPCNDIKDL